MSATRNPNLDLSPRRARRRRLFLIRLIIILFLLLALTFTLAILSGHDKVIIKTILVSGNGAVGSDEILMIANRDMAGRYGHLFARNNFFLFSRFRIKADILKEVKAVKDLKISWAGWQTITVTLEERKPHSVWCGMEPQAQTANCFFADQDGYVYGSASTFSGSMFVRDYGPLTGVADSAVNPVGGRFLTKSSYGQIFDLIGELDRKNLKVTAVSFDGFDYRFVLEEGPVIIFNDKNGLLLPFANLFSAVETGSLDLTKEDTDISYVDLRFDNKIVIGKKSAVKTDDDD